MHIKRSIKFILHKRTPTQSEGLSLRMRVRLSGKAPFDIALGRKVDAAEWDAVGGRVRGKDAEARRTNAMKPYIQIVDELKARAMKRFDDF